MTFVSTVFDDFGSESCKFQIVKLIQAINGCEQPIAVQLIAILQQSSLILYIEYGRTIFFLNFPFQKTISPSFTFLYIKIKLVIVFILVQIINLFYCVLCRLGSHRLFSIGSYDKRIFLNHFLWKTQREDWNQGKRMT